jgi:trans-aconitate methyltransferase
MHEKIYYTHRFHPQRNFSKANVRLYNTILDLGVETIFEFGCGIGRHIEKLNSWGFTASGMDISLECVEEARGSGLNVLHGDETVLKHISPKDLVFTNSVLCHMSDIEEAQKQIKRIAKKYIIACECVSKINDYWWIHEYEGELIHTIDSHLDNGAMYNLYLLDVR